MKTTIKQITIATRESPLALWQAEYTAGLIEKTFPWIKTKLLPMTTKGDQILSVTLDKIGGKGLFLKELEQAMIAGKADIAVHSMKDVPADMPKEFSICSIFKRHESSDAFVSNNYNNIHELPQGAIVGTSSLRRQSQLLALRPDIKVLPLRGNVQTRLKKLDDGNYDAIILATAGLERMQLDDRIKSKLMPNKWLPAVGQGAVGVECLSSRNDLMALFSELNYTETQLCVEAERSMNKSLNGSCSSAIGASAVLNGTAIKMHALVATPDGTHIIRQYVEGENALEVGIQIASNLISEGAQDILDLAHD